VPAQLSDRRAAVTADHGRRQSVAQLGAVSGGEVGQPVVAGRPISDVRDAELAAPKEPVAWCSGRPSVESL